MSTKTTTAVKAEKKPRMERKVYTADEKCQAVLSIWTERRKPSQVCREMGVNWTVVSQWEKKALSAMLKALEPRQKKNGELAPALGPKLEKLLEKTSRQVSHAGSLEKRLGEIHSAKK